MPLILFYLLRDHVAFCMDRRGGVNPQYPPLVPDEIFSKEACYATPGTAGLSHVTFHLLYLPSAKSTTPRTIELLMHSSSNLDYIVALFLQKDRV